MKRSELKQLIRETIEEVYSQQDEGIMDFVKNLTGKGGSSGSALGAWGALEKANKEISEHNLKQIDTIISALSAKRDQVNSALKELWPVYYKKHSTADGESEYYDKPGSRTLSDYEAERHDSNEFKRIQEKTRELKEFIGLIEGTASIVREFEKFQKDTILKPLFLRANGKDILYYVEEISDRLERCGLRRLSKLLKPFGR